MNLNLAEMTVLALCHFLFKPFEECDAEDHIHLGEGFLGALPGLSIEMREKVIAMAKERLEYLNNLPSDGGSGEISESQQQELAFLDSLANDPEFIDRIGK